MTADQTPPDDDCQGLCISDDDCLRCERDSARAELRRVSRLAEDRARTINERQEELARVIAERDEGYRQRNHLASECGRLDTELANVTAERDERLTLAESSRLAKRYDEACTERDEARRERDMWQLSAENRLNDLTVARREIARQDAEYDRAIRQRDDARADRDRLAAACALIDRELTALPVQSGMSPGHEAIAQALAATGWPGYRQDGAQEPAAWAALDEAMRPVLAAAAEHASAAAPTVGDAANGAQGTAQVSYAQTALDALAAELPDQDPTLLRLYTLLALTKGTATTLEDVHDAWALWRLETRPDHPSIVPFAELTHEIQELDRPYMEAIHRTAAPSAGPAPTPTPDEAANGAQAAARRVVDAAKAWRQWYGEPRPPFPAAQNDLAAAVDALGEGSADD